MKLTKKITALFVALALMLSAVCAFAATLEPEEAKLEKLSGATFSASVGDFNPDTQCFKVTVVEGEHFEKEDVEKLQPGDAVLVNSSRMKVASIKKEEDGTILMTTDSGEEYYFTPSGDEMSVNNVIDDRAGVRIVTEVYLPLAKDCVLEDKSDLEAAEPKISKGLEEITKAKEALEKDSNGLDCFSTTVTVNENLEITHITRNYDVSQ